MHTHTTHVLIIGSGGAALRAALAAAEAAPPADVTLITKGTLDASGVTATACSDRMAFHATLPYTEPDGPDNWHFHAEDIYRIGGCVSDGDLAAILARNAADAFDFLDGLGVPFVKRNDGRADQFVTDGSKYARACYTGPHTANHIHQALVRAIRASSVKIIENTTAFELVVHDGRCRGAIASGPAGVTFYSAPATILATGGAGKAFAVNVFPPGMTGDGPAMALRAGAELVNMEFIQIGLSSLKTSLACSGSMFRALPRVVDASSREILLKTFPGDTTALLNTTFRKGASWPVSYDEPSHVIDVAVFREIAAGGRVFLDYSANPSGYDPELLDGSIRDWYRNEKNVDLDRSATPLGRLQQINAPAIAWLKERGIDLAAGDRIEIAPAAQHFQGGIKIRTKGQTCLPGLYAAGEAAGGQHGANRPGGNALMDCQVFGRIAGTEAANFAMANDGPPPPEAAQQTLERLSSELASGSLSPEDAMRNIQHIMSRAASVVRTTPSTEDALRKLAEIRSAGISGADGLAPACEARNLLDVAQAVLAAIAARHESRGPHLCFGSEHASAPLPRDEERYQRYFVIRGTGKAMAVEPSDPVPLPAWND